MLLHVITTILKLHIDPLGVRRCFQHFDKFIHPFNDYLQLLQLLFEFLIIFNKLMNNIFTFLIILALIHTYKSTISLHYYRQLERSNPSVLFDNVQLDDQKENFPSLQKLIFLTPWNKKGFQYTLKYSHKIDYVSPCWYTLKIGKKNQPIFENQQNYDERYAKDIKEANQNIKLIPRIYVEGSDFKFFQTIGSDSSKFQQTVNLIEKVIRQKRFDGIVWDTPYNFFQKQRKQLNQLIGELIKAIRIRIGDKVIMFNMANPLNHMKLLDIQQYNKLPVNSILIQNYDSGDNYLQMVHKSIEWSQQLKKQTNIMLMLPFFSVKTNIGPLSTEQAIRSLKRMGAASNEIANGICKFVQNKTKRVFLIPCFTYFDQIFRLAEVANASVGFWQGGNGLQAYYKFL